MTEIDAVDARCDAAGSMAPFGEDEPNARLASTSRVKSQRLLLFVVVLIVSGCVTRDRTAPIASFRVIAVFARDVMVGQADGYLDRTGTVSVKSTTDDAMRCVGSYFRAGRSGGHGSVDCSDGSHVPFRYTALTLRSGYGFGSSPRGAFSFTFGLTLDQSLEYLVVPPGRKIDRASSPPAMIRL